MRAAGEPGVDSLEGGVGEALAEPGDAWSQQCVGRTLSATRQVGGCGRRLLLLLCAIKYDLSGVVADVATLLAGAFDLEERAVEGD